MAPSDAKELKITSTDSRDGFVILNLSDHLEGQYEVKLNSILLCSLAKIGACRACNGFNLLRHRKQYFSGFFWVNINITSIPFQRAQHWQRN
jgi:hypothetical protein